MPTIKGKEISQQAITEALRCDTVDALLEVAEKYDIDLDHKVLAMVAGGKNW